MSFKCDICGEEFFYNEEVWGFNCNGDEVSLEPEDIELNAQNPDYWVKTLCNYCFLDDLELDKDKGISEWEQVIEIIDTARERKFKVDNNKYPSVSKLYHLGGEYAVGIDQSIGEDKTVLAFAKTNKNGKFEITRFQEIEKQEDMDKYININKDKLIDMFKEER